MEEKDTCFTTAQTKNLETPNVVFVKGRLKKQYDFWKINLKASSFILSIVKSGYILPFLSPPPPFYAKNNLSALRNKVFVDNAIHELLEKNLIQEIEHRPHCCNPLTVAEGKKLRLVLDLRHVNKYLRLDKFKYDDLNTIADMLDKNDFFTTFDLVSGYHHVDINQSHYKYLGFEWTFSDGSTRFFQFLVLAFGLSTACYVFTKLLRPFVKKWRGLGIKLVIYLDDGINAHSTYNSCKTATEQVLNDLRQGGFIINLEKSQLEP